MEEFKNTKNKYKQEVIDMSVTELQKHLNETNILLMRARNEIQRGSNPYHEGRLPVKILKWKKTQLTTKLNQRLGYGGTKR